MDWQLTSYENISPRVLVFQSSMCRDRKFLYGVWIEKWFVEPGRSLDSSIDIIIVKREILFSRHASLTITSHQRIAVCRKCIIRHVHAKTISHRMINIQGETDDWNCLISTYKSSSRIILQSLNIQVDYFSPETSLLEMKRQSKIF